MPNETETQVIHPHFKIVAIETTSFWRDDLVEKTGKIWSTFLFDENRHVHLCSLTPSYELWFIEQLTEKELDEDTWELLFQSPDEEVGYYDVSMIDRKTADHFTDLGQEPIPDGETYGEVLEYRLEQLKCNQQAPKVTWVP